MKPYGITIFCDDLRLELGGKFSLMGCFGADIILGAPFPASIRLGMTTRIYFPIEQYAGKEVVVHTFVPGQDKPLTEAANKIPISTSVEPVHRPVDYDPKLPKLTMLTYNSLIGHVQLTEPGYIRVRAVVGDEVIRCGALLVRHAESDAEKAMMDQLTGTS